MSSNYPDDIQFAGLVEAATAAADAHQRDLGKRKRGSENAYIPVSSELGPFTDNPKPTTLANSAAVLFREPSEKSKKYSRPPLGKVFTSLELSPESFLKLQSAAKDYMLSDDYPERKDVVGHKKHNGNNDHAKLKLYQCVEEFLQQDGNGENFFGHSANADQPDMPPRTFFWPEDRGRIVRLLMPLLRKMVTNERQRLYAAETRKGDVKKVDTTGQTRDVSVQGSQTADEAMIPEIDPSLQNQSKDGITDTPVDVSAAQDASLTSNGTVSIDLQVNIILREDGVSKRVVPQFHVPAEGVGTFEQFVDGLKKNIDAIGSNFEVKALLPTGLTTIKSEDDWIVSQMTVLTEVWMNSQLQILVEV